MIVSLKELKKYVDTKGLDVYQIGEKLSKAGLEVEKIFKYEDDNIVVGKIIESKKHPNADNLLLLKVDVGSTILQIVCGAKNAREGKKVIVAKSNTYLPALDLKIKKTKIRGETSNGMCCALNELGINNSLLDKKQIEGIEELPNDSKIGECAMKTLNLDDYFFDIDITPNRGDAMSIYGIARDLGAILDSKASFPKIKKREETKTSSLTIELKTKKCDFFALKEINNIKVEKSPLWLETFLRKHEIKPINNIVDIGNYVMLLTGQPIHMYDLDKVGSKNFELRDDFNDKVETLDDETNETKKGDIVIVNNNRVECFGGIIGSKSSMIDEKTKNIAIEAASFDHYQIRKTTKRLQFISDSAQRFIKKTDKHQIKEVLDLTVSLLEDITTFSKTFIPVISSKANLETKTISTSLKNINNILGIKLDKDTILKILNNLFFQVEEKDSLLTIKVPPFRNDINREEDIIEEIIRIHGFGNLKLTLPNVKNSVGKLNKKQKELIKIKTYLANIGFYETINSSFTSKKNNDEYSFWEKSESIEIMNPLNFENRFLRISLIPSLIEKVEYNLARNISEPNLFEISKVYSKNNERHILSLSLTSTLNNTSYLDEKKVDFYAIKGVLQGVFNILHIENKNIDFISNIENKNFHPYRSAKIKINNDLLGVVGQIHPSISNKNEIYVFELDLDKLLKQKRKSSYYKEVSPFPIIKRDLSFYINKNVKIGDIIKTVYSIDKKIIKHVEVFDIYKKNSDSDVSLAIRITFQSNKKTLKDEDINKLNERIINSLNKHFAIDLR